MKPAVLVPLFLACALPIWAEGEREAAAATTNRAEYLAQRGTIIPQHEIRIDSLIAGVDYAFPEPEGAFGVSVYTGHKQVSAGSQSELVMIGLQGRRWAFKDLPPLNLALVVDKSGSMGDPDELAWIKESVAILLQTLRDKDYLALISFDEKARLLVPSVQMDVPGARERILAEIEALSPGGDSNIIEALALGFHEVITHFAAGQTNRLMLLTDGWGNARDIKKTVQEYRARGVEVSVVGYGEQFDTQFADGLVALGGSSRFISDRSRMEEVFGSGLARSTVPLARDIALQVTLKEGWAATTWGYDYAFSARRDVVSYRVPAVHNGDYETMLLVINLPQTKNLGVRPVLAVQGSYTDLGGASCVIDPVEAQLEFVADSNPLAGFSDARVLKAGSMLHYAFALQQISDDYYHAPRLYETFFRAYETQKELKNTRLRLSDAAFDEPIDVLKRYAVILGAEIGLKQPIVEQIVAEDELPGTEKGRALAAHLDHLFRELLLRLKDAPPGPIAVSGFRLPGREDSPLADFVNQAGTAGLANLAALTARGYSVVERERLDAVLREQELALSDLVEPGTAVRIGRLLAARYLVTGSIIPAAESVVVFGRIIDVETAVIESAAQVVIPRTAEIDGLL